MAVNMTTQTIAVGDNWTKVGNDYVGDNPSVSSLTSFFIAPSLSGLDSREPTGEASKPDIVVSGNKVDRGTITISTSTLDFGPAPTIYLDYTGESDTVGQAVAPVPSNGASLAGQTAQANVVDDGMGASRSWYATQNAAGYQIRISLPDVTQLFTGFKYKLNNKWPGTSNWPNEIGEDRTLPSDSAWKMTWLGSDPADLGNGANSNLCLPTYYGGNELGYTGNSHIMANNFLGNMRPLVHWEDWTSVECWLKAGTPLNDPSGTGRFSMTGANGRIDFAVTGPVFDPNNTNTAYKQINVPGWIDDYATLSILYSDIYLADIPSRVLIGDHSDLTKCRFTTHCGIQSWASQSITATMRVPHSRDANLYAFVIGDDGAPLSTVGIPVAGGNI